MKQTGKSVISQSRIEQAMQIRYSPFPELSMSTLTSYLNLFRAGDLQPGAKMFEIMIERDGKLSGPMEKRQEAVAGLEWDITPIDESPEAERHVEALKYFYGNLTTSAALDRDDIGDVSKLINQVSSAIGMRYFGAEMLLRPDNPSAKEVTAEFIACPVWFFESRSGRLRFLQNAFDYTGVPLLPAEWLTAVGHGYMRQCSIAYAIKHFPLTDWMTYCSRFGIPGIHGETPAAHNSTDYNNFVTAMGKFANDWVTVTGIGTKINLIEAKGGPNLPFGPLVDASNRLYSELFRGSDLATSSRDGASMGASIQQDEIPTIEIADCKWINGIFNARIDIPVIAYLFGTKPLAWFTLHPKNPKNTQQDLLTADFLTKNGVAIGQQTARDRFGWPAPAEGEEVLKAPAPMASPFGGQPGQPGKPVEEEEEEEPEEETIENEATAKAQAAILKAVALDLAPMNKRLKDILNIEDAEIQRDRLAAFRDEFPRLARDIMAYPAAASAFNDALKTQIKRGARSVQKPILTP